MSRRPYQRPVSTVSWWLAQPRYVRYMGREVTSLFIGAYTGVLVVGLVRLWQGPATWDAYLAALQSPASVAFHLVAFAFALYHTTTWFNVTPKAMPLYIGTTRLPARWIVAAHYAGWIVFSLLVLLLVAP